MTSETFQTAEPTSQSTSMLLKPKFWWRLLSIVVTLILLIYLLNQVKWDEFQEILTRISPISLLGAASLYLALNFFRAVRFRILLDRDHTPLRLLFPITMYHNFLVRVLPFKLGEVSYIVMLRTYLNYSVKEGISSLFGARLLELLIIIAVFMVGIVQSTEAAIDNQGSLLLLLGGLFVASLFALYYAGSLIRLATQVIRWSISRVSTVEHSVVESLFNKLDAIALQFDQLRQPRLFASALFLSLFTFTTAFLTNYILMLGVGVDASFPIMITIIGIGMFASAFPFSVSGFGVVELSWAFGLAQIAGLSVADATAIGFLLHGFQIIVSAAYGLFGYIAIRLIHTDPEDNAKVQHTSSV